MTQDNSTTPFQFEQALEQLSLLVEHMEQGNISLEDALKSFEKGIKLTQDCQKALQEAEQKVSILLEKNGKSELEPFDPNDD